MKSKPRRKHPEPRRFSIVLGFAVVFCVLMNEAAFALPPSTCVGDCNRDHVVTVDELVLLIRGALGDSAATCPAPSQRPGIVGLVRAVNSALYACGIPVTYRLTDTSTILYSPGDGSTPAIEPLSGTFTVVDTVDPLPNCLVSLSVLDVDFRGDEHFVVSAQPRRPGGCPNDTAAGCFHVLSFAFPHTLTASIGLSIEGQRVGVQGSEELEEDFPDPFPTIQGIELCGHSPGDRFVACADIRSGAESGYVLTISAVTEEKPQQ